MKKVDTKGKTDPAFLRKYYGNMRRAPNNHCEEILEGTIFPGWYETIAHQNARMQAAEVQRRRERRS